MLASPGGAAIFSPFCQSLKLLVVMCVFCLAEGHFAVFGGVARAFHRLVLGPRMDRKTRTHLAGMIEEHHKATQNHVFLLFWLLFSGIEVTGVFLFFLVRELRCAPSNKETFAPRRKVTFVPAIV
jgi:hypothetical protein